MKTRHFILGNVALAALLGSATFMTAPAFAQKNSTPEEAAQTRSLNAQAAPGTEASPEQLNGEAPLTRDNGEYDGPANVLTEAQQSAEPAAPRAEDEQYERDRQTYQFQKEQYKDTLGQYQRDRDNYHAAVEPPPFPEDPSLTELHNVANAERVLRDMPVDNLDGHRIGRVLTIEAQNGAPISVEVGITSNRAVWMDPEDLRYDRDHNALVTDIGRAELLEHAQRPE